MGGRRHRYRTRDRRVSPVLVVLAVAALILPSLAGADYLQMGVDAARTGATSDVGPARDTVAFERVLPGSRANFPLIIDGAVYAPVQAVDVDGLNTSGVVRVDLDTARTEVLVEMDTRPMGVASDGQRLYISDEEGVLAYPLSGGEPAWSWSYPAVTTLPPDRTDCEGLAVTQTTIYVFCLQMAGRDPLTGDPDPVPFTPGGEAEAAFFLAAVGTAEGQARWTWVSDENPLPTGPEFHRPGPRTYDAPDATRGGGIAVVGERVFVTHQDPGGPSFGTRDAHLRSFDRADGTLQWTHTVTFPDQSRQAAQRGEAEDFVEGTRFVRLLNIPTGTTDEAYFVVRDLIAVDADSGQQAWRHPLPQPRQESIGGHAFALSGEDLYVGSRSAFYKIDRTSQSLTWTRPVGVDEHIDGLPPVLAGDRLYARTHSGNVNFMYAFDPADGDVLWKHEIAQDPNRTVSLPTAQFVMSVGDGVMAIQGIDGTMRVLGHTPASLQPAADVSDAYPGVGQEVRVDLSGTEPGVDGPATEYQAVWGDGTATGWQPSPVLDHAYAEAGDHDARLLVRNDAGQTASIGQTFHVGEAEPNLFTEAFQPEHQDLTFGVIGLALALGGGAVGLTRRYRKRSQLRDELQALEEGFEQTRDNPGECEAFLDTRKARARSLVLDGDLTEEQFGVVTSRIEELQGTLRTTVLDSRFEFLPHGMVESMKDMLAEGGLSAWERDAIDELLEGEETLTEAQRDRVRDQLDRWFTEDAGR